VVISIEELRPDGASTPGDSITVAPIRRSGQGIPDHARPSFAVIRAVGVETGGSNIQFAVTREWPHGDHRDEPPRLAQFRPASKATGFPIARSPQARRRYLLDEIRNDITRETPASFEPTIDLRPSSGAALAFEKFPQARPTLNTQMKSVGEAMSIGRTFRRACRSACVRWKRTSGLGGDGRPWRVGTESMRTSAPCPATSSARKLSVPNAERVFFIRHALRAGFTIEEIFQLTPY